MTSTEANTALVPPPSVRTGNVVPYREAAGVALLYGDCQKLLGHIAEGSVRACITSPPYWNLRDYGGKNQLGREATIERYVAKLTRVFDEVRRVLSDDGTLWLNLGECWRDGELSGRAVASRLGLLHR